MSIVDGQMFSVGVGEYSDVALPSGGMVVVILKRVVNNKNIAG